MQSKVKSKRLAAHKTREDFLRWLKARQALTKKAAEDQDNQADQSDEQGLVVQVDDEGIPD